MILQQMCCLISHHSLQASFVAERHLTQALDALATKQGIMDVLKTGCERLKLFMEIVDAVSEVSLFCTPFGRY